MAHSIFITMPTFVILFWLVLFILDDNKNEAKIFFTFFLSIALVNYIIHWFYFNQNENIYNILENVWIFTSLSVYPLYYYYIRYLTKDKKINYNWIWMLIPAFTLATFSSILYILMSPQEIETFTHEILFHNRPKSDTYSTLINLQLLRMALFKLIFTVEVALVTFFGLRFIREFNEKVLAFYSDVQHREVSNIRFTLLFLLITAIVSSISNFLGKDFFIDNQYLLAIPSIAHSIALFGVSYAGYKQTFSIRELTHDQIELNNNNIEPVLNEQKKETGLVESKNNCECELLGSFYDELYEQMEHLLKKEQVFRNSDLRLNELASMLGTNRTYVSRLINNKENSNFCDYINKHRIRYAKQLLASEQKDLSLQDIAIESGFSNNSSFYRVFTKIEGTSPAKYRKEIR